MRIELTAKVHNELFINWKTLPQSKLLGNYFYTLSIFSKKKKKASLMPAERLFCMSHCYPFYHNIII